MSRVARVIKPKVKVHWALNASPRCNKIKIKKPFPRGTPGDKVLVEREERRTSRGAINRHGYRREYHSPSAVFFGMPQSSTWGKENLHKTDQVLHCLPSSCLSSTTALKTRVSSSSVCPHVLQISILLDFLFLQHAYFVGQKTSLWMNNEFWNDCWVLIK